MKLESACLWPSMAHWPMAMAHGPLEVATLTVADGFTLSGGNFDASASTGTFQTGSGAISLNGPTLSTLHRMVHRRDRRVLET